MAGRKQSGVQTGSAVWMTNPDPLTRPCLTPPRDAHPREELRDSCSRQSLDPAPLPSQGSLLLLPSMDGSPSSIRTLLRGREDAAGRDLKKQEELQYRRVSEACPWVRSPAKAPTSGQHQPSVCLGGCLGQKLEGPPPGPAQLQNAAPKNSTICIKGRAAHTLALCPRGHPPTMLLPHGGSFQWGCPGWGKGSRY